MHRWFTKSRDFDLVGAVDGEIDPRVIVEGGEGNPQREGLLVGALGGGNADDVGELPGGEEGPDLRDHEGGGGAGAQAEDHAAADVLDCLDGGEFLEVVLSEGSGGGEGSDRGGEGAAADAGAGAAEEEGGGGGGEEEGGDGHWNGWATMRWWKRKGAPAPF